MINTVIGALIAAVITFGSGALALLTQDNVNSVADIRPITWIVLGLGTALAFLKDFQAIWTRTMINKVTGSGDGGGNGPLPTRDAGFTRFTMLVYLAFVASVTLFLFGCAANPARIAETNSQRAYAVYGQYVILEEQAAEFICGPEIIGNKCPGNPAVPDNVRALVKQADAQAAPVAGSLLAVVNEVSAIRDELTKCPTNPDPKLCQLNTQQKLQVANANLIRWLNELIPLIAQLKTSVGR